MLWQAAYTVHGMLNLKFDKTLSEQQADYEHKIFTVNYYRTLESKEDFLLLYNC
jgi:hypothetical protein